MLLGAGISSCLFMGGSLARAAELRAVTKPATIADGNVVPQCAWAPVVELYGQSENSTLTERCTGVYVGDRVVLTAAHCVPRGFSAPVIDGICTDDGDCPSLGEYDNVIDLDCDPLDVEMCSDPDRSYSNRIRYALFGEEYIAQYEDQTVRKAVLVAYCHRRNDASGEDVKASTNDFAYCVLTEEPNVQPVHPMMHCEADLHLGEDTVVHAVGFGRADGGSVDSGGVKRTATSSIWLGGLDASDVSFTLADDWSPGQPISGDSGGPLLIRLPDETWRVVALASTNAVGYVSIWPQMEWLATDPNVDIARVLPCHDTDGNWDPGPNCTGFVRNPDVAEGSWARAPQACYHGKLSEALDSCGAMVQAELGQADGVAATPSAPPSSIEPEDPPPRGWAEGTNSTAEADATSPTCSVSPTRAPAGAGVVGIAMLVIRRRRGGGR